MEGEFIDGINREERRRTDKREWRVESGETKDRGEGKAGAAAGRAEI